MKLKIGVFKWLQIRELMKDPNFPDSMNNSEKDASLSFPVSNVFTYEF